MIGHLAHAAGSPCPTLVLDARYLPTETERLLEVLTQARRWLADAGGGHVLKIALVAPSPHPLFDLDYQFVQALPAGVDQFDLRGSCGHSVLAAITSAAESRMLPKLGYGDRVRVNVLNNGDQMVCEINEVHRSAVDFNVHFVWNPPNLIDEPLLTGQPRTVLHVDGRDVPVSFVSVGNPYVFVDAGGGRVSSREELFSDDHRLFHRLVRIRRAAAEHLGWPVEGAFPKVAVTLPLDGRLAVRAVSVPSWHPTLALTGAACLGAATGIAGTVPWSAAREAGCALDVIDVDTPGGSTSVTAVNGQVAGAQRLLWTTVTGRRTTFHGSFVLEPLVQRQFKEIAECLFHPV